MSGKSGKSAKSYKSGKSSAKSSKSVVKKESANVITEYKIELNYFE